MSTTTHPTSTERAEAAGGSDIVIAFLPWVLFSVAAERWSLVAASIVALVAAALIARRSIAAGNAKILELGTVATFGGFTVASLLLDASAADTLTRYSRAIAIALLALIAFGSLLFTPFTEQYARESAPRELWGTTRFRQVNRSLTAMWAFVFLAMLPSHIVAARIDTRQGNLIFNWAIPVLLIVWASKRTARVADEA
jgi:hypothetical protein